MRLIGRDICPQGRHTGGPAARTRGQSAVELALVMPLLMLLFGVLIEGSLALSAWIRVNTAARDATRFVLDAGPLDQAQALVLRKLNGLDATQVDIYIVQGATGDDGHITGLNGSWVLLSHYGPGAGQPRITSPTIDAELNSQGTAAATDMPFYLVEVDYNYRPLVLGAFINRVSLPMSSYAIVQQVEQPNYSSMNYPVRAIWAGNFLPIWKSDRRL